MLYNGHDAPVGHIPYQNLSILGHAARQKQAVVVRKIDEGHAVVVFRQSEEQTSLLETPDYDIRVLPSLARSNKPVSANIHWGTGIMNGRTVGNTDFLVTPMRLLLDAKSRYNAQVLGLGTVTFPYLSFRTAVQLVLYYRQTTWAASDHVKPCLSFRFQIRKYGSRVEGW